MQNNTILQSQTLQQYYKNIPWIAKHQIQDNKNTEEKKKQMRLEIGVPEDLSSHL